MCLNLRLEKKKKKSKTAGVSRLAVRRARSRAKGEVPAWPPVSAPPPSVSPPLFLRAFSRCTRAFCHNSWNKRAKTTLSTIFHHGQSHCGVCRKYKIVLLTGEREGARLTPHVHYSRLCWIIVFFRKRVCRLYLGRGRRMPAWRATPPIRPPSPGEKHALFSNTYYALFSIFSTIAIKFKRSFYPFVRLTFPGRIF